MKMITMLLAAMVCIGCGEDSPVGPSPLTTQAPTFTEVPGLTPTVDTPSLPRQGIHFPEGWTGYVDYDRVGDEHTWTVHILEAGIEGGHILALSFWGNQAVREATTQHNGGGPVVITGDVNYAPRGSGVTVVTWTYTKDCGRGQLDIAISDRATRDRTTIVGYLEVTERDCLREPPPPPPPGCNEPCGPPPPPPPPPPPGCVEDCEPPDEGCPVVDYDGPSSVVLDNSGEAAELELARTVAPGVVRDGGRRTPIVPRWPSDAAYQVVLVKAGRVTYIFANVKAGEVLEGFPRGISHVSVFNCP